ncbi:MAG: lipopolysaccharide transport periplasmic protein LptA [Gammaproteobacteria bacterium]|nr:MAG: lipopolysaccharide transport periplasmic protein LptA [Gammaproteobacteria bacterium]
MRHHQDCDRERATPAARGAVAARPPLLLRSLLPGLLLLCGAAAFALPDDAEQPIAIEADAFELDDLQGIAIYSGAVVATQGSIRLEGDKLTVRYDKNQDLDEVLLQGKLARFRQQREVGGEWIKGKARRIEYYPKKDLLILLQQAEVTEGKRLIKGDRIEYDIANARVKARKATTSAGKEKKGGRVRIVIPPKKKTRE